MNKFKQAYPQFAKYILDHNDDEAYDAYRNEDAVAAERERERAQRERERERRLPADVSQRHSVEIQISYHETTTPRPSSSSAQQHRRPNAKKQPQPPPSSTFLYYNNVTKQIEGLSLHSTFATIQLANGEPNMTLITTSTSTSTATTTTTGHQSAILSTLLDSVKQKQLLLLSSLYHQFIYKIRFPGRRILSFSSSSGSSSNETQDVVELLNEQTRASSRLRVQLVRNVAQQLGVDASTLRLNWIERLSSEQEQEQEKRSSKSVVSAMSSQSSGEYINDDGDDDDDATLTFSASSMLRDVESSASKENSKRHSKTSAASGSRRPASSSSASYYYVLISLSNVDLLDKQSAYLLHSQPRELSADADKELTKQRFARECSRFFELIGAKHDAKFKLSLVNLTLDFRSEQQRQQQQQSRSSIESHTYYDDGEEMFDGEEEDEEQQEHERDAASVWRAEKLGRVKFLRLCDLERVERVMRTADAAQAVRLATSLIESSTHEKQFNSIDLADYEQQQHQQQQKDSPASAATTTSSDDTDNEELVDLSTSDLPPLDASSSSSNASSAVNASSVEQRTSLIERVALAASAGWQRVRDLFNSLYLNDGSSSSSLTRQQQQQQQQQQSAISTPIDPILVVALPVVIILSLVVLALVVACLLGMAIQCGMRRRTRRHHISECRRAHLDIDDSTAANAAVVDAAIASSTLYTSIGRRKSTAGNGGGGMTNVLIASPPLHLKFHHQRPYTSGTSGKSGVPVIFYEEMSMAANGVDGGGGGGGVDVDLSPPPSSITIHTTPVAAPPGSFTLRRVVEKRHVMTTTSCQPPLSPPPPPAHKNKFVEFDDNNNTNNGDYSNEAAGDGGGDDECEKNSLAATTDATKRILSELQSRLNRESSTTASATDTTRTFHSQPPHSTTTTTTTASLQRPARFNYASTSRSDSQRSANGGHLDEYDANTLDESRALINKLSLNYSINARLHNTLNEMLMRSHATSAGGGGDYNSRLNSHDTNVNNNNSKHTLGEKDDDEDYGLAASLSQRRIY